jgi:hypothetical protein
MENFSMHGLGQGDSFSAVQTFGILGNLVEVEASGAEADGLAELGGAGDMLALPLCVFDEFPQGVGLIEPALVLGLKMAGDGLGVGDGAFADGVAPLHIEGMDGFIGGEHFANALSEL